MEEKLKQNYEQFLLLLFGIVALVVSGLLIFKSVASGQAFSNETFKQGSKIDPPALEEISKKEELLASGSTWTRALREGKPVPFGVSNLVLEKEGAVFQMADPASTPLWPPVDNPWWLEHKIDPTDTGCLDADADSDGFTNLAEFTHKTNPQDAESRPDWPTAVHLVERVELPYQFKFAAYINPEVQITRIKPLRNNWFKKVGETTGDGRFKVLKVLPAGPDSIRNPARVELFDNLRDDGNPVVAVQGQDIDRPEYQAKLGFEITADEQTVKKGQEFSFKGLNHALTVVELAEDHAIISYENEGGQTVKFRANLKK